MNTLKVGVRSPLLKKLMVILMGITFLFTSVVHVNAFDTDIYLSSVKGVEKVVTNVSKYTQNAYQFKFMGLSGDKVQLDMAYYFALPTSGKRDVMSYTLKEISQSSMSTRDRNKLYNEVAKRDDSISKTLVFLDDGITGNLSAAMKIVQPLKYPVSVGIGVLLMLILIWLVMSTVIDLAFLTLPLYPIFLVEGSQRGYRFISSDAFEAYTLHLTNSSKNKLGHYAGKRLVTLTIVSVFAALLVSGKWVGVLSWIIDLVNALTGL